MSLVDLKQTASAITGVQTADGAIPWGPGRHIDPWNHIEAAMGLDSTGFNREAERGYEWLAKVQRPDGAWPAALLDGCAMDPILDANFCAYVAVGAWHHFLCTGDDRWLRSMWSTIETAIDFVLDLQMMSGAVSWARDERYRPSSRALLTSSSCIHLSLWCAVTIADRLNEQRPDWELSLDELGAAVRSGDEDFLPKDEFAMDWYYPILGGATTGDAAVVRLEERWGEFVVPERGVLCTADKPWVTTGETSELVLTCVSLGLDAQAEDLYRWVHHLRDADGMYWTGANHPGIDIWPREKTTWSAGSVLLAADAIGGGPTAALFRGTALADLRPLLEDPERPDAAVIIE